MSSHGWTDDEGRYQPPRVLTDDELLDELRGALAEEAVDDSIIQAAQAVFTWRTVDAELEVLGLDREVAGAAPVRGGAAGPQTFRFHGGRLSVDVEIDDDGIVGQLSPPGPGQVTLVTADGPQTTVETDEVGGFTLPLPPPGPMRLDCRLNSDHFVTEWVTP